MEKIKLWLDVAIAVFGLLAALAVILSLIYGSKIEYDKKLEEKKLNLKVAESNAFAEKAKEEAATALVKAAEINEKAKLLELQVEEQKERAARAERDLMILNNKVKPRSVENSKIDVLISDLSKFQNKKIFISSSIGDGESVQYANQLKAIFDAAGWEVSSGISMSIYTGIGVYILTRTDKNERAEKLISIFSKAKIDLQPQIMEGLADIQIFVGSKNTLD